MPHQQSVDSARPVVGWREWVALPQLGVERIKAKIDTGARSSSLHAFDLHVEQRDGVAWVRFRVHPIQRDTKITVESAAPILEYRHVRSSSGHATRRPVILTEIELLDRRWPIEVTLANRDEMGFRMLIGREAVRGRFLVDAGTSYLDPTHLPPPKPRRRKNRTGRPPASEETP